LLIVHQENAANAALCGARRVRRNDETHDADAAVVGVRCCWRRSLHGRIAVHQHARYARIVIDQQYRVILIHHRLITGWLARRAVSSGG
jgi:hypothetical protein